MKIVIVHYRYADGGGPERYMLNVKNLLEKKGHNVIPFSLNYIDTIPTIYQKYFPLPLGDNRTPRFSQDKMLSINKKIKIVVGLFFNRHVYLKFNELLENEKPEIVYVLQFWAKLSVSLFTACRNYNIKFVIRLSDYWMVCANNIFFRNGAVCTKCTKSQWNAVRYSCVQDSRVKTLLNFTALKFALATKFHRKALAIVTPSRKMSELIKTFRPLRRSKIIHIPTFINKNETHNVFQTIQNIEYSFCYVGRLSIDKGVHVLIDALLLLKDRGYTPRTCLVGDNNSTYGRLLMKKCEESAMTWVEFKGILPKESVLGEFNKSQYSIIPSVWFDNMPNSLIESQSCGVPVIASDIGSLSELVEDDVNGFLFEAGKADSLAKIMIRALFQTETKYRIMQNRSIDWVTDYCSEDRHYNSLMEIFSNATRNTECSKP